MTTHVNSDDLPIAFSAAVLLCLMRIFTSMAGFGEVAREMLLRLGGAISKTSVVTISELVRASHCTVSV
jgi:hypothetical protein